MNLGSNIKLKMIKFIFRYHKQLEILNQICIKISHPIHFYRVGQKASDKVYFNTNVST